MRAVQRSDGVFVDVHTDARIVSFQRPTLVQYQVLQELIVAGKTSKACLEFAIDCACNRSSAQELFNEWPGAFMSVATALVEMVTPKLVTQKAAR